MTYEWASAMGKGKPLIPMLIEDCQKHPKLEPLQHIDFRTYKESPWDELFDHLNFVLSEIEMAEGELEDPDNAEDVLTTTRPTESEETAAARLILEYLNKRGFQMVSNERIQEKINGNWNDDFLDRVRNQNPQTFRLAHLRDKTTGGTKRGLKKI